MQVPAPLKQVQVCLVSHKQLVASVADVDGRRVDLVAVAEMDAVEVAAYQHCHGIRRTIPQSGVHHLLLMGVLQAARDISPPSHTVVTPQSRGVYC